MFKNTDISFEFTGTSSLIAKLKKLSIIKWKLKMHDFDPNNADNDWLDEPTAKQFSQPCLAMAKK
ncbi:hypothetical protein [Pedobacter soli]|uniref:Uncharacterized protein n=1 Tax=Pedobacter soli TaxID=390242 RepID=A0A1G6WGF9_9SPHI|nr:hypothetical protein [Pedobacter soli]SDD64879.1 hypothetical protein SAMN04488024_1078 [Pedobacter soli]